MYNLPEEKIARYPLERRDESKLLVYKDGEISESVYKNLADFLPENSLLVRNVSKVLPARIVIGDKELLLTRPIGMDYETALLQTNSVVWNCLVKGLKAGEYDLSAYGTFPKGKASAQDFICKVTLSKPKLKEEREWTVEIYWKGVSFSEILNELGTIPLPRYMERTAEETDFERYQTIFGTEIGSVASPTASLHMTSEVLDTLKKKNIEIVDVILHVGLGTFIPMETAAKDHIMHAEYFEISNKTLSRLVSALSEERKIIALGTTAFRTLESLSWVQYWYDSTKESQKVEQWIWKKSSPLLGGEGLGERSWNKQEFLNFVETRLGVSLSTTKKTELAPSLQGETSIMCIPEYQTNIVDILLTNFHQTESTLLQLVSGFVKDDWKQIYQYALDHDFRFLSYGDTSLLWKNTNKY